MYTPGKYIPAPKATMPPTPMSAKPTPSLPGTLGRSSSAYAASSTPISELETPRAKRSTSNRFWEKNAIRAEEGAPGVDLASDSDGDPDEDSEVAHLKKSCDLDAKIKRLLVLETGPVRLKSLQTNEAVCEYVALLEAFAKKPRTNKKRMQDTDALMEFLQEHAQVVELYNQFAQVDTKLRKDRALPEFNVLEGSDEDDLYGRESRKSTKDTNDNVRRAPAKHALNQDDDSDEEGIVRQTIDPSQDFDEPSIFNTRELTAKEKTSAMRSMNIRRFLLHKREEPQRLHGDNNDEELPAWKGVRHEVDGTPTRPSKRRKRN